MTIYQSMQLPITPTSIAPDGSDVRVLLNLTAGGMAHFTLAAGKVAQAIYHRTVEEIWYIIDGSGEMWRNQDGVTEVVTLQTGLCLTIPINTQFQFKSSKTESVTAIGITMPCWPGDAEAVIVQGPWTPT